MGIPLTVAMLVVELVLLACCYVKQKQPANPARPRLIPYVPLMIVTLVLFFGTLAHLVGTMSGHPIVPRTSKFR